MINAILIDDEEIALDVLEILLEEIGGVQVQAKFLQAGEAIERVAELRPDLIFLDIEMPGLNGLVAAEQLQQRFAEAEIIFVTAYKEYALHAFDVNAKGYLLKPVSKERLAKLIDRYRPSPGAVQAPPRKRPVEEENASHTGPDLPLRLQALGSLELYSAGGELFSWRTKKTKELFAYLWHHDGMPVYRDHILEALWPELHAERAQALLHTTMYHLRHMLKAAGCHEMIIFADERYRMRVEGVASDVKRLESKLGQARDMEPEELLGLYRGDYMETEHYRWAESRREELRAAYVHALEAALTQSRGTQREALLRRLIKLEPFAHMHYYRLLLHLDAAGHAGAVLKVVEQLQRHVHEELGLEITPAMQKLIERYHKPRQTE
ncbi:Two-component response regulator, SAPR family, consists of REC, wHTH and BTAD domains [Paenibacillus sp. UNCCL117]|uniref:response regulator n=1 Tax=unclassified Paenibacillus TaxID=185978 RepID=UPI00088492B8|nr:MULTISPECIES: response regulator [unclassified Paenibacillus]SDD17870.1 Two-component response regulator, SAPR family, consists of REC, wHTH and BTAD domains [Paenibacillus sp. cl123]SFW35087.1 Two-component response regulator, SAPR family, consists of REC, wHTH and BTAD domains [Paenibacillus sp. UNCCL117]